MREYKGLCYSDDFKILYEPKRIIQKIIDSAKKG